MKTNTEYKNAALAALKGNWAKAVLAAVVYIAIMFVAIGPYMFYTAKMQAYRMENMPRAVFLPRSARQWRCFRTLSIWRCRRRLPAGMPYTG